MVLAAVLLSAEETSGQSTSPLAGVVTDSDGLAVYGALVSVAPTGLTARTDERGEFRFSAVPAGAVEIQVRRIGFVPATVPLIIVSGAAQDRLRIHLSVLPTMLDKVTVERTSMRYTGRLAGYYQRLERRSGGQFITRTDIEKNDARSLSQLVSQSPGVNSVQLRVGSAVRMRGRNCRPLVWIDGVSMPAAEVDLDAFPLHTLHGIELYLGGTTAPMEYTSHQNRSSCGSILLWSRGRDTESRAPSQRQGVDLESLVASMSVHTADQVDRRAELASRERLEAAYPPELYATRASGSVTAEFVVDAGGRVEQGTFTVVSSTHALLAAAVTRALEQSRFVPALKDGKAVRQFVRQRFDFGPRPVGVSAGR